MEMLPPAPSVGEVPEDEETASTTALIAQVPRIALEELARRMLENPGSVSRADFEAALGERPRGEVVAQAPPRGGRACYAIDARPPPLGVTKHIHYTPISPATPTPTPAPPSTSK